MKKGTIYQDNKGGYFEFIRETAEGKFEMLDLFYSRDGEEVIPFYKEKSDVSEFWLQVGDNIEFKRFGDKCRGEIKSIIYSKSPKARSPLYFKEKKEGLTIEIMQPDGNTKRLFYSELKEISLI